MPAPDNRDVAHLQIMLEVIGRMRSRLQGRTRIELYASDRDELDLAAYRLSVLGEKTNKLSAELKDRHPGMPWDRMYHLRNIVAHAYEVIDPVQIWAVVGEPLDELEAVCRAELARAGG